MNYAGKKVAVFGGFGFIGLNLIKRLIEEKAQITVLDTRETSPLKSLEDQIAYLQGDIRDRDLIYKILQNQEVLFNLAGKSGSGNSMQDPELDLDINCRGVLTILETAKELGTDLKVIFPGSRLEFGKIEQIPVGEDHPMRPTSIYGIHKLTAEKYHLAYFDNFGLRTTVFRISNPFGPHLPQENPGYNIINYFFDLAYQGKDIKVFGEGLQKRDYLYIDDLIDLFLAAGLDRKSDGQVYNVGSGVGVTLMEMAKTIVDTVGRGQVVQVPWEETAKRLETGDYVSDISKVEKEIGWKPRIKISEGVKRNLESKEDSFWVN